jgi:hypothetical protein
LALLNWLFYSCLAKFLIQTNGVQSAADKICSITSQALPADCYEKSLKKFAENESPQRGSKVAKQRAGFVPSAPFCGCRIMELALFGRRQLF